jgi:HAE1 family hydrophobic/amphiphilic exporter-1
VRLVDRKDRSAASTDLSAAARTAARMPGITVTHIGVHRPVGGSKSISVLAAGPDLAELERLAAR